MSTDLIQRLRFLASGQDDAHSKAIDEAADELERKSDAIQRLWAERDQLRAEVEALRRGEFICQKCGLRKDADAAGPVPF